MSEIGDRINQEWIVLNAIRGMVKIASKGDMAKSTYNNSLNLGGAIYPELLGPDNSILRKECESDTTKEYRQKAELQSIKNKKAVTALELVLEDIEEYESLISIAEKNNSDKKKEYRQKTKLKSVKNEKASTALEFVFEDNEKYESLISITKESNSDKKRTDQLKRRLGQLRKAKSELEIKLHSENQLIFRDAYIERDLPELSKGHAYRDFQLPDGNYLRLRVLHPDKPEHITGADIIYERHNEKSGKVSIVVVQYKIWDGKKLYISDSRMKSQIQKMKTFTCDNNICLHQEGANSYRFPCCTGFLRPTDKLQNVEQKFISTGEHLPICQINDCKSKGEQGGDLLEYEKIKGVSLSAELFEYLFNRGKIGSRELSKEELKKLYLNASVIDANDTVVIYAQEF